MSASAPVNPATLAPGDRVRLYSPEPGHALHIPMRARFLGKLGTKFGFGAYGIAAALVALDDGTLRDNEGRVVEVLSAE
jgi:hypothetical protein